MPMYVKVVFHFFQLVKYYYMYFMLKLIEFLETVFFVLRKKQHQITFLHMYHHVSMALCAWVGVRFIPGGHQTLMGFINCIVHIFMYLYYMLAAFGPEMQKYLWWKKYLTIMQIVQFVIVLIQNLWSLFLGCDYPKIVTLLVCLNAYIFIHLFSSFYIDTYIKPKKKSSVTSTSELKGSKSFTNTPVASDVKRGKHD